jgi:hypothetical protein
MLLLPMLYLPPLSYMALINRVGDVTIEAHESYIKSSYRNRCEIIGSNANIDLSIPVAGGRDHHQLYTDTLISYDTDWQHRHRMSIISCYGSTPFFEHYIPYLQPFYEKRYKHLFEYNKELLTLMIRLMKLNVSLSYTEVYEKAPIGTADLRHCFKPGRIPNDYIIDGYRIALIDADYMRVFDRERSLDMSCLDLLFNEGPQSRAVLQRMVLD